MKKLVSKYKGYTFYEYLQASDGAFINTNIKFNKNNCYEFNVRHTGNSDNESRSPLLGSSLHNSGFMSLYHYLGNKTYSVWIFGTQYGNIAYLSADQLYDSVIKIDFPNTVVYTDFDNIQNEATINTIKDSETDILIFTCGATTYSTSDAKLYSLKIKYNDVLVRDYVPASNGTEYGLYDLVNDVFYVNAGTGTFSVGEQISIEVDVEEVKGRFITKNLANLKDWVSGYLNSNGTFNKPDFNNLTSNYIDCKPNTKYYYYHSVYGNTTYLWSAVCYYNQDKSFIKREYACDNRAGKQSGFFTTPPNCYYIRVGSRWLEPQFNPKVLLAESSVATDYVPYIQTAKEIKITTPQLLPTINNSNKTVYGITGTFDGYNLDFKGINNSTSRDITFSPYYKVNNLKVGKYIFATTCIRNNGKGICYFYIYGKKNGKNYYYAVGVNATVGITQKVILDLEEDMLQDNVTVFSVYPQIDCPIGDSIDYACTFRVIPIVNAKEIKTKINGEIKTINLDYELAEDVEPSLLSLDEEDNNNSDTDAPDTI